MDLTVKDNFFKDPQIVRDLALSLDLSTWTIANAFDSPQGWRGMRSLPLRNYKNKILNSISQQIFNYCWIVHDLSNWRYPSWEKEFEPNTALAEPMITTYFHYAPETIKDTIENYPLRKYHQDFISCAGVIYLNPFPLLSGGTSILDGINNKIINVKNKYNRFVAYDGYELHAPSKGFGNTPDTNRLTLTFFIHEKKDRSQYEPDLNPTDYIPAKEWQHSRSNF
jgi:hypothetical protein